MLAQYKPHQPLFTLLGIPRHKIRFIIIYVVGHKITETNCSWHKFFELLFFFFLNIIPLCCISLQISFSNKQSHNPSLWLCRHLEEDSHFYFMCSVKNSQDKMCIHGWITSCSSNPFAPPYAVFFLTTKTSFLETIKRTKESSLSFNQHKSSLALVQEQFGWLGCVLVSVYQHLSTSGTLVNVSKG